MKIEQFPSRVRAHLIPEPNGDLVYRCLGCGLEQDAETLLYTCPACDEVLLISDRRSDLVELEHRRPEGLHVAGRDFERRKRRLLVAAVEAAYRLGCSRGWSAHSAYHGYHCVSAFAYHEL